MNTKVEVEVVLTPDQLAEVFISWSDHEQGKFLNLIGKHFKESKFDAEMQCCHLADHVTKTGRDFIYTVANFIKVRGIPLNSPKLNPLINSYDGDSLRQDWY